MKLRTVELACGLTMLFCGRICAQNVIETPSVTLAASEKIVAACESLAKAKGWKMAIWVVDDNAEPVFVKRMQGASPADMQAAQMKAKTSKAWAASSDPSAPNSRLGKLVKEPQGQVLSILSGSLPQSGGLPIIVDGKLAGAIGIAGGNDGADAQCAQAGLNAISK